MIKKILLKYTVILIVNLFAFLTVWYILDKIFETGWGFIVLFLILSVLNLVVISHIVIKKDLKKLNNIKPIKNGRSKK